ncbi:hypothetical protein AB4564_19480 [Vibrio sp. 10N.222.51.E8]|uniref:hypothetical protein n=1 Tax=unclassified Vibrio TaxID=2614977 RepID=UPI0010BCFD9C|nr:hypothetical protein [Vibrio sp. F13]TKG24314.1 hypothetical protein FCV85_22830 [Vibrio sp. F13]
MSLLKYWAKLAMVFLNNELRITDAHDAIKNCIDALQSVGFDTAKLSVGYERALDFVLDEVIVHVANQLELLLEQ